MNGDKILVVDDDVDICEILQFNFTGEGFDVEVVHSAEQALEILDSSFSLVLLDVMMGGMSGYKMAEYLKKNRKEIPIIFLTAKSTENEMLTGFSVGADDYISKPFSIKEVIARVKAVLKRAVAKVDEKQNKNIFFGDFSLNSEKKEVAIKGKSLTLTKTEYKLLVLLIENQDKIFSREEIIDQIWADTPYITERTVDVHIARLRKKMGEYASYIVNRLGYGYKFQLPE